MLGKKAEKCQQEARKGPFSGAHNLSPGFCRSGEEHFSGICSLEAQWPTISSGLPCMSLESWTLLPSVDLLSAFLAQPLMGTVLSSFFLHQKLHFIDQLKAATQPPLGMVFCAECFLLEGRSLTPTHSSPPSTTGPVYFADHFTP